MLVLNESETRNDDVQNQAVQIGQGTGLEVLADYTAGAF